MHFDPLGDGISNLSLINAMGDDQRITMAARVSLAMDGVPLDAERDAKLIRYLLRHGHWSCFEHCYLTVRVVAPLPVIRQWQRHTSWRFNEVSRRYTSENVQLYTPQEWQASAGACEYPALADQLYRDALAAASHTYNSLVELGVAREQARLVLPQAMYSSMYASASLRSAIHFIGLRATDEAQSEMRAYAEALGQILAARWPVTWQAWSALREVAPSL
jgi:thymidylate synthase (FAD)